jgi:hypothetical protein
MARCPACKKLLRGSREDTGARCPHFREPLYEWHADEEPRSGNSLCAVHPGNLAVGTCQRCGNYLCQVCRTRWRERSLCVACVERSLEAGEASPEETRAHLRQAVLGVGVRPLCLGDLSGRGPYYVYRYGKSRKRRNESYYRRGRYHPPHG